MNENTQCPRADAYLNELLPDVREDIREGLINSLSDAPVFRKEPREGLCMVCGRQYPTWYAPNELWNRVMRCPDGSDRFDFVCPTCFTKEAVDAGVVDVFVLGAGKPYGSAA